MSEHRKTFRIRFANRAGSSNARWNAVVLIAFVFLGSAWYWDSPGEDLASSYLGCRLIASGQSQHLYDHSETRFNRVDDLRSRWAYEWRGAAVDSGFWGRVHPYVQTPLWVFALQPLCTSLDFSRFNALFDVAILSSLAGIVWLVARHWTPRLFRPLWIAALAIGLALSEPFRYALYLSQTHALVLLLTVAALVWARKGRNFWAGALLAVGAAIKITPGFLMLYWLMERRWKSAFSFAGWSALILAVTWVVAGPELFHIYRHTLDRISDTLLVAFNNQSLAAWWMGRFYSAEETGTWRIHPLPPVVKAVSLGLALLCQVLGGLADRWSEQREDAAAPAGAVFALIGATIFSPIAWTHYFVLLIVPAMLFLDAGLRFGRARWIVLAGFVWALNVLPLAVNPIEETIWPVSLIRSHFYAGFACLAGFGLLAWVAKGVGREAKPDP